MAGGELRRFGDIFLRFVQLVGVDGLQAFIEGLLGLGGEQRLTGSTHAFVARVLALQVDVDFRFEGDRQGDLFLCGLVTCRLHNDSKVPQATTYEECASVGGRTLVRGNSVVIKLHGGRRGDRLSGAVADGDRDFHAVAAEHSSFTAAVLAESRKRRHDETKKYWF